MVGRALGIPGAGMELVVALFDQRREAGLLVGRNYYDFGMDYSGSGKHL